MPEVYEHMNLQQNDQIVQHTCSVFTTTYTFHIPVIDILQIQKQYISKPKNATISLTFLELLPLDTQSLCAKHDVVIAIKSRFNTSTTERLFLKITMTSYEILSSTCRKINGMKHMSITKHYHIQNGDHLLHLLTVSCSFFTNYHDRAYHKMDKADCCYVLLQQLSNSTIHVL